MKSDYVVVDTISVFKQRYIIPREEVERFNEEVVWIRVFKEELLFNSWLEKMEMLLE